MAQIQMQVEQTKLQLEQMRFELEKQKAEFEMKKLGMEFQMDVQNKKMEQQAGMESMQLDRIKQREKISSDMRMMQHKENLAKKGAVDGSNKRGVRSVEGKPSN